MEKGASQNVVVLCSGFGLGFYIPGLLISEKLRRLGITTEIEVFESLLPENKIDMVERNRQAYHANFKVAIASQKVPGNSGESLNHSALESLLAGWRHRDCRNFICLSGHWVTVLDRYRELRPDQTIRADLLYLDADLTASWRQLQKLRADYAKPYREVRPYDNVRVNYSVGVNAEEPLSYIERNNRMVVHGGGWGIGTFQERVSDLERAGCELDIVCYAKPENVSSSNGHRFYMDDPTWRTWHRNSQGEHTFPPFGEITAGSQSASFAQQSNFHGLYRIIRDARGIVSKPGAGTLIDSFASATPLIMLEPFGPAEKRNADVWEASGFGVQYPAWATAGYPISMLEELHCNIMQKRNEVKDYAQDYAQTLLMKDADE